MSQPLPYQEVIKRLRSFWEIQWRMYKIRSVALLVSIIVAIVIIAVWSVPSLRQNISDQLPFLATMPDKKGGDPSVGTEGSSSKVSSDPKLEATLAQVAARISDLELKSKGDRQEVQALKDQLTNAIAEVIKSNELLQEQKKEWELTLHRAAGTQSAMSAIASDSPAQAASGKKSLPSKKVNINTASAEELHTLPGIGPAFAQRIIGYRNKKGVFHQITELLNVTGIKKKEFDKIKDSIEV